MKIRSTKILARLLRSTIGLATLAALLTACRSAPHERLEPRPIHVIEVSDRAPEPDRIVVTADDDIVWWNGTGTSDIRVVVAGYFDPAEAPSPHACFRFEDDEARTWRAVAPGDAVTLRLTCPGIYEYTVHGPQGPILGDIVVRDD